VWNVVTALEREEGGISDYEESLTMIERSTRSVRFEDGLKLYKKLLFKKVVL